MFCYHVKISRFGMGDQEPKKIAEVTLLDEKKPNRERMDAVMHHAVQALMEMKGEPAAVRSVRAKGGKEDE